ncbi:MAG: helix-turn-helix domain-containing protein [Pseudomonadota bacterium]
MEKKNFNQVQKLAILRSAQKTTIREVAKVAGVHYTTVYDWRRQFEVMGEKAFLEYRSSKPGRGIKQISPEKEPAVLREWKENPGLGPGQIRNQLRRQRITISMKTVRSIMHANGYKATAQKKDNSSLRFESSRPLELTQMDILEFKKSGQNK